MIFKDFSLHPLPFFDFFMISRKPPDDFRFCYLKVYKSIVLGTKFKGEASLSIYADWVNGGWFKKPNSKSLGKFG